MEISQADLLGSSTRRPAASGSSSGDPTPASSSPLPSRSTSIKRRKAPASGLEAGSSASASHSHAQSASSTTGLASGLRTTASRPSRVGRDRTSTGGNSSGRRTKDRHALALESIRHFLKGRSSYDMLPVSFRLIVLDTQLVVGPALDVMWGAGVVSAPLWHSIASPPPSEVLPNGLARSNAQEDTDRPLEPASAPAATTTTSDPSASATNPAWERASAAQIKAPSASRSKPGFAGMLTVNDIIHLIQYYYHHASYDTAKKEVETFRLEGLRDIEAALAVPPPPLLSCHPLRPLLEACQLLMKTHARRLPLLDYDEQTGIETVVSVLTQYRILKFIAMNCRETASLHRSIRSLGVGTFIASYKPRPTPGSRRGSERSDSAMSGVASAAPSSAALAEEIPPVPPLPHGLDESSRDPRAQTRDATGSHSRSNSQEQTPKQELTDQFFNLTPFAEGAPSTPSAADTPSVGLTPDPASGVADTSTTASTSGRGNRTIPTPTAPPSSAATNPYHPIYTATLDTTVFDVVHMFSERGISAVPIVDEEGNVVDMYETVDVITLVRSGAYQDLDLTIRSALTRRPADFPGVYSCSPEDSVANIFALLRRRRVHRLLIIEPEPEGEAPTQGQYNAAKSGLPEEPLTGPPRSPAELEEMLEKQGPRVRTKRGKLVGILALSDLLRHIIGIPSGPAGGRASMRRSSSDATSSVAALADEEPSALSSGPASQGSNAGGATGSFPFPHSHAAPASVAPNLSPVPGTGNEDATIMENIALETPKAPQTDGGGEEVNPLAEAAESSSS
ncbi:hypothetical protein BCV69DRAFT_267606 [Microstroma glucosiphilum]|uniref:CBS domain-containing protein n=1 Tax=Pseudomicrostroma glucosiphilum TaxID=1684307 RepID=A0A316UBS7_9BASI|nr:hypothetical protein BCV69DRAFT_267606 [Pseudomicrostroma glucosiphilum]PWN22304.1 hypothetical protein BCV69DRAFT_267606 [Pseudomicrostroma glucosiphilum]